MFQSQQHRPYQQQSYQSGSNLTKKGKSEEKKVQCKLEKLPSWVLVDLNVHSVRHPNKSKFSHCSSCGKAISGEPNTLCMVTSYLLNLRKCLPLKISKITGNKE